MSAKILSVTPTEYHRLPQFSSTLAKLLVSRCAEVARDTYERKLEAIAAELEDDGEVSAEKQDRLDRGNILHALVLGKGGERIVTIPAELLAKRNGETNPNGAISTAAAKDFVAAARKAGQIPVKPAKLEVYAAIGAAIRRRIAAAGHEIDGVSELAIGWTEATPHGPVDCRGMLDHVVMWGMSEEDRARGIVPGAVIYDLKICDDASPARCERTAYSLGYDIQAVAYPRALAALYPALAGRIDFRFLFVEPRRPYADYDPRPDGAMREMGKRRWLRAVHAWGRGLATGQWDGYRTDQTAEITSPSWALKQEGFTPEEM